LTSKWASSQEARNGQQSGRSSLLAMNKDVPIPYCPFYRPFTCQISAHEIKRFTQCEQMALDAIEGEQKLNYTEGRREHLWRLLQGEGPFVPVPQRTEGEAGARQGAKEQAASSEHRLEPTTAFSDTEPLPKRPSARIGERVPRRDTVGAMSSEEKPKRCSFSGAVDLSPARLTQAGIAKLQCPECGAMWTARIRGTVVSFPPHPPRSTRVVQTISRWIKRGGAWELSEHKR
jgi:hypothetical protein